MKLFTAALGTETHTFAPLPTDTAAFEECYLVRGGNHPDDIHMIGVPLVIWRDHAKARGWEVVESLCTFATPSGITVRKTFETFRDEILADLKVALPVDGVILSLHGAMVAHGYDDCEGDLVHGVRELVGPGVPIGVELDLHCHLSRQFIDDVTAVVIYKEYPHIDAAPRAEELWKIMEATLDGKASPVITMFDCRMIGVYHTTREPMISYVKKMQEMEERDGVLSVSLAHGFPWGDIPEEGTRLMVVTDGDETLGRKVAEDLGREFWSLRDVVTPVFDDLDTAVGKSLSHSGKPMVLADMADNPGGGAVGDSTFIVKELLDKGERNFAVGSIWDPISVEIAISAGEGTGIGLRIGGKISAESGDPLDVKATVKKIVRNCVVDGLGASKRNLGDAVCLDVEGAEIIIHSARCQNFNPTTFTALGIDYASKKILVVKSMQHFYAAYEPVAGEIIYVAAPGTLAWDFSVMPYDKVARPVWPVDEDPWATNEERPW
ncbi:M81 family metallopeptidase [Sneathiella marina]|uniref:Microcystinase C n=1 Tax=Sneathiella marina TaxID=2950108 RepID=A0ABY4WAI6_9PROT|nr:M81 family metallopeptidase [Sneathiella marina]USG63158.1 M81 family metallopeptidase [Sneathiella marina]